MDNTIANILIQVRLHKRLTQKEVAEFLRIPLSSYSSYERGVASPRLKVLKKLSDLYGISIDQLAGRVPVDIEGFTPSISHTDLKAFTMAAMQGLLGNPDFLQTAGCNFKEHKNQSSEAIALTAINVARTTLFYLQNEQK